MLLIGGEMVAWLGGEMVLCVLSVGDKLLKTDFALIQLEAHTHGKVITEQLILRRGATTN